MLRSKQELIEAVNQEVNDALAYFGGPALADKTGVEKWIYWDTLAHFLYWHDATTWAIYSAVRGGPPWRLSGTPAQIREASIRMHRWENFAQLMGQALQAQKRLTRGVRVAKDIEAPALELLDGATVSIRESLEQIVGHWASHLRELRAED